MLQRLTFALLGKLKPYNCQLIARVKGNPSGAFKETLFKRGINVIHCSLCEFEIETCRKLSYYRILLMYCRRLRNKVFDVNLILAREATVQWETIRTFVTSLLLHLPIAQVWGKTLNLILSSFSSLYAQVEERIGLIIYIFSS